MRRIALITFLFFSAHSALALTTLYVNTASAAGGNCTTSSTSGANRACAHLADAVALLPSTLADAYAIICAGGVDSSQVLITVTTSATNTLTISADSGSRHAGVWSNSKYNVSASASGYGSNGAVHIASGWVSLIGLQIKNTSGGDERFQALSITQSSLSGTVTILGCIIDNSAISCSGYGSGGAITLAGYLGTFNFRNNLLIGSAGSLGLGVDDSGAYQDVYIFNNTIVGSGSYGWRVTGTGGGRLAKNNLFYLNKVGGNAVYETTGNFDAASDYNSCDNAAMGYAGTHAHDRVGRTFTFSGASDYHLGSGDAGAKGFGVDLSATFTDDIDGVTRSTPWDIGADQYLALSAILRLMMLMGMGK